MRFIRKQNKYIFGFFLILNSSSFSSKLFCIMCYIIRLAYKYTSRLIRYCHKQSCYLDNILRIKDNTYIKETKMMNSFLLRIQGISLEFSLLY